jgi:hypothetical protein
MIVPGMLELMRERPNWLGALSVALTRPPGMPERRTGEDPWSTTAARTRPRRITDDLAWLRQAMEDPGVHGLRPIPRRNGLAAWAPDDPARERLVRLRERHVLEAAGFELTDVAEPARVTPPRFERQPAEAPATSRTTRL